MDNTPVGVLALGMTMIALAGCPAREPSTGTDTGTIAVNNHHQIDYIEFNVTDMAAAKRFYTEAFDWEFTDYGDSYAGIRRADGEAGGLSLVDEVTTGGPLVILYSKDLDDSLERVRAAGGTITQEPFSFPGGRRFHFTDPSGNQLAVWALP